MGNFHLLYLGKKALGLGKYMARKSGLPCAFRPKSLGLTNPLNIYCFFPKHSPVLVQIEMRFKWDRFVKSSLYLYISSFSVQNKNDIGGVCFSNVLTPFALSPISKPSSWLRTRHISLSMYLYLYLYLYLYPHRFRSSLWMLSELCCPFWTGPLCRFR